MPGPKMGPRPADFDEDKIKKSPTYMRWLKLEKGEILKYACREFIRGRGEDDERLMRRILIARRNNLKDHETLKKARKLALPADESMNKESKASSSKKYPMRVATHPSAGEGSASQVTTPILHQQPDDSPLHQTIRPQQGPTHTNVPKNDPYSHHAHSHNQAHQPLSDAQIAKEMDVKAVEATRSYKKWITLSDGEELVYNQKYIKGQVGQDWLLRKNIWRRMRYRRENKRLVDRLMELKYDVPPPKRFKPENGQKDELSTTPVAMDGALNTAKQASTTNYPLAPLDHLIHHPLNPNPLDASANHEIPLAQPHSTTSPPNDEDHETALQASAAAAAAILKDETGQDNLSLMDPAVVAAAMAAAESFVQQSSGDEEHETPESTHNRSVVEDVIVNATEATLSDPSTDVEADAMAAAVAAASAVTPEDIAQVVVREHEKEITGEKLEDDSMVHLARPLVNEAEGSDSGLVLVHDPLQAAALAAQLAQVSGAVEAAEDLVHESVMDAQPLEVSKDHENSNHDKEKLGVENMKTYEL